MDKFRETFEWDFPGVHIFSLYQTISLWFELKFFHFIIFSLRVENLIEFNFA